MTRLASVGWRPCLNAIKLIGRAARPTCSYLFQAYRDPADSDRHFGAYLWTTQLQDHAIGILQLNSTRPDGKGTPRSDSGVPAFDRSRPLQIDGSSNELGGRCSDREADAHA